MRIATLITAAAFTWMGASVLASTVTYDYDRAADFSRFRSYSWVRGTPVKDELNHKRIMNAVDSQLAARGMTRVDAGDRSDVFVSYHAAFDESVQISAFGSGWAGPGFAGSRIGSARADRVVVGSLVVDVVDAHAKTIVWRGIANQDIDLQANGDKRDRNINKAMEKLFKNYPPKR